MFSKHQSLLFKSLHWILIILLVVSPVQAQVFPTLNSSSSIAPVQPVMLRGVMINTQDPMQFDFIITGADAPVNDFKKSSGDEEFPLANHKDKLQQETTRLAKYFLTSVALSDQDLWVNLSPVEPDRIIPSVFGQTDMGKILLEQDAVLKQITSELMNPESETGKELWNKVYGTGYVVHGEKQESSNPHTTYHIPPTDLVESFNKVWIVPGESLIVQDGSRAFIKSSRLKVMLESDYLNRDRSAARQALNFASEQEPQADIKSLIRQIVVPAIEREINEGDRFAPLRQVFSAHLLAVWYKNYLKQSFLNQVYADSQKINGIAIDPSFKSQVYEQYLQKFKNGAFDVIKEDYDPATQQMIARKYFSGGVMLLNNETSFRVNNVRPGDFAAAMLADADGAMVVPVHMRQDGRNNAMLDLRPFNPETDSVLIVDDNQMQRMIYAMVLKNIFGDGVEILQASSADEVLKIYNESLNTDNPVGLIVSDFEMDVEGSDIKDGVNLARALVAINAPVPVVMHSATMDNLDKAFAEGGRPANVVDVNVKDQSRYFMRFIEKAKNPNQAMLVGVVGKESVEPQGKLDVAPGGIDFGYGKNVRMEKSSGAGDIPVSGDIIRLRQNLKGIVPVPSGQAVPLREFLSAK